jgi:hypothetical protein
MTTILAMLEVRAFGWPRSPATPLYLNNLRSRNHLLFVIFLISMKLFSYVVQVRNTLDHGEDFRGFSSSNNLAPFIITRFESCLCLMFFALLSPASPPNSADHCSDHLLNRRHSVLCWNQSRALHCNLADTRETTSSFHSSSPPHSHPSLGLNGAFHRYRSHPRTQ